MSELRGPRGAEEEENEGKAGDAKPKKKGEALDNYCVNLNKKARDGKIDPLIGPRSRGAAHDSDPLPPLEEQSALRG